MLDEEFTLKPQVYMQANTNFWYEDKEGQKVPNDPVALLMHIMMQPRNIDLLCSDLWLLPEKVKASPCCTQLYTPGNTDQELRI